MEKIQRRHKSNPHVVEPRPKPGNSARNISGTPAATSAMCVNDFGGAEEDCLERRRLIRAS